MALERDDLVSAFQEFARIVLPRMMEQTQTIRPATMNIEDAATYLGVHPDTVRKLIREKEIPHVRVAGRILLRAKTLDEYMEEQERKSVLRATS
jgi:excisionase family DNA binding protein